MGKYHRSNSRGTRGKIARNYTRDAKELNDHDGRIQKEEKSQRFLFPNEQKYEKNCHRTKIGGNGSI